jgi:DNA-binding HxlR family transcriptional regulator
VPSPEILEWSVDNCTLARAVEVFGDRSSLLILREVSNGVRRFADIRVRTGVPRQVLTDRLAQLVGAGILERRPYREDGQRTRYEYRFTDKGIALIPVLVALNDWGSTYLADSDGPPLEVYHRDCGAKVKAMLVCADGHVLDGARETRVRPGPGARRRAVATFGP